MALEKSIELSNGVTVNYHRVVSVNIITNLQNTIEVASYTSQSKRNEEVEAIKNHSSMNVYIDTKFISVEYDQDMTVESAYEYLKTLPKYEDAIDV